MATFREDGLVQPAVADGALIPRFKDAIVSFSGTLYERLEEKCDKTKSSPFHHSAKGEGEVEHKN